MSLLKMAASGLKSFASTVKNSVVNTVSNSISSYANGLTNMVNGAINSAGNLVNNLLSSKLGSGSSGLFSSSAGNLNAKGNNRDNSIYDYMAHFKNGVMKSSRFRAEFNLPRGVSGGGSTHAVNTSALASKIKGVESTLNKNGSVNVKCNMATFPERSLQTIDFKSNSVNFKMPWSTSYQPISLSFYADGNLDSREYFELWQSCVMNFGNNTMNFYNEYVSDVKLYLQNDSGADAYGIILYEAYPVNIGLMDISYGNSSTVLNVMISLSFKSWLPLSNSNSTAYNRSF